MTQAEHTKAPEWTLCRYYNAPEGLDVREVKIGDKVVAVMTGDPDSDVAQSRALQLVKSVNACRGLNPEAIQALVKALGAGHRALAYHGPCENNNCSECKIAWNLIVAALAAVKEVRPDANDG